jgi:hypothetical protein
VFDLTWVFARENLSPLLTLLLVTVLPPWLFCAVVAWGFDGAPWVLLLVLPFLDPIQAPFTLLGGRLLFDADASASSVLRELPSALGRLVGALAAILASWLVSPLTCMTMLVPILGATAYLPETALLERVPIGRGIQRSMRLAGANPAIALFALSGRAFLTLWCAAVAESFGQVLLSTTLQLGAPFGSALEGDVTPFLLLGVLVAQPIHALYRLLLYVDVRTRVEGWDLQVGLRAAGIARRGGRS